MGGYRLREFQLFFHVKNQFREKKHTVTSHWEISSVLLSLFDNVTTPYGWFAVSRNEK